MSSTESEVDGTEKLESKTVPTLQFPADPLNHLSAAQIEEIYLRYLDGEKTSDLIKEFEIKTNLNSLLKLLPHIEHKDLICPYCEATATQRRAAKNSPAPQPACTGCKHVYASRDDYCSCAGCSHAYIRELNGVGMHRRVPYAELTIREKIILLSALTLANEWDTTSFSVAQIQWWDPKLAPTREYHDQCINELFQRGIVIVSDDTHPQHLDFHRKYQRLDYVSWKPNVSLEKDSTQPLDIAQMQLVLCEDFRNKKEDLASVMIEMMYEIAIEELMEYLLDKVSKTRLVFKALPSARATLRSLLPSKSISDIFGFIWKAVKQAEDALGSKTLKGAPHAGNLIPSKITQAADYFESCPSTYKHKDYFRMKHLGICQLSKVIYGLILDDHDGAFKMPLPRYIDEVMRPALEGIVSAKAAKALRW